ncbi:MAG: hypothetical protein ABJC13_23975 [Acidobacteriota bacterium]
MSDQSPVRFAAVPDVAAPKAVRTRKPKGKTATGDPGDTDPKGPPKKIMSASGAFSTTPSPAGPKRT